MQLHDWMIGTALLLAELTALPITPVHAAPPHAAACAKAGVDDTTRPITEDLVPAVNAAFGTRMPASVAVATTVFRCDGGNVLACTTGANLPCGKADLSRKPVPGAVDWCRSNPSADFIPAYMTGTATIYAWRCQDGAPQIVRQAQTVDKRGFIARYWKQLN